MGAPMIKALLAGTKTQTRRALKRQPIDIIPMPKAPSREWVILEQREPEPKGKVIRCRLGAPGDVLWVRETFAHWSPKIIHYAADRAFSDGVKRDHYTPGKWRPSIHMPRKASR